MAPKRKAPAKAQTQDKKVKQESEEDSVRSTVEALKTAPKEKLKAKIDSACQLSNGGDAQIHEDYDCMLNQTNIGNNNNKFYIIQLIAHNGSYSCWNRWGRVGEVGQSKLSPFPSLEAAKKDFEKKFREKTKNSWAERENFVAHPGKYTLIEVQHGAEEEQEVTMKVDSVDGGKCFKQRTLPCSLDKATQELVSLIFSNDMFKEAMQTMNIDVKKMPLGKLSKQQIAKGFEALEAIETALQEQPLSCRQLEELSSRFYTIIPHSFGRARPPPINTQEIVQAKKDMLLVLADIELAQSLQAQKKEEEEVKVEEVPHPLDKDYELLKCELTLVDPALEDYQVIQTYVEKTGVSHRKVKILNIWKVKREGESERFKAHDNLENRRLLWHGTNVAVVAAILKSGLRIMPHSGGRVGKGLYFASENSKSVGYVSCTSQGVGIMFLNEVALGKEYRITQDDSSLRKAPPGYDSVIACGRTEPDPACDRELMVEGRKVLVPQGKPIPMAKYQDSSFSQSEYLIYQESQCQIRYLLQLRL
ncbi:protein mono-ADP-ribosyltransferase PARP3 isoform X1 [Gopherus evgoodei]|uniref:protein mono-ADP-ribosyltransferase PARP3 isoform X1 n=1 Tax=Gopherus evgoodei TaxID=1825980 RepID=UPI0011CF2391|nr:protein mono-ADP-ribosyltransferase PARP3 isoform X1 [Gopherus evgoodei]XP_030425577.1 protein mono-ADP-ribosyltransferase PARP3 isoform X1 [Gopherus evgoodei]XP_030425578.1 protein mono-ADP-ribosyltransferase PARP3 isoform X1 [Gopherus evgoodei]XP_030425579.1 protein mono-ADP-ribosyltransferase PARP3 isoform X1 [Gopherus evgoodei]XP_030425580.1 protein mono-ADP-ribosyltransferase PARP3 isoform X1 [Gopherus evgoodei]XP_030425582.1 protein mono-ADP-ribosyltransferase PARP3 isoform X1 [Gopher